MLEQMRLRIDPNIFKWVWLLIGSGTRTMLFLRRPRSFLTCQRKADGWCGMVTIYYLWPAITPQRTASKNPKPNQNNIKIMNWRSIRQKYHWISSMTYSITWNIVHKFDNLTKIPVVLNLIQFNVISGNFKCFRSSTCSGLKSDLLELFMVRTDLEGLSYHISNDLTKKKLFPQNDNGNKYWSGACCLSHL